MSAHRARAASPGWFLAAACLLLAVPAGATVLVSYEHYVHAIGSDGVPLSADVNLPGATWWAAEVTKEGHPSVGNYGHVKYDCDLATGRLRTHAFSRGVESDLWPYHFTATGRVPQNRMVDRITFTVPAGTYPDGVAATLRGTFKGWIQSDVGAGCQFTVSLSFGDQDYSLPLQAVGTDVAGTLFFDTPIALTLALVAPGGELPQATEYARDLAAALGNCHAWSVAYHDGSGYVSGNAEAQFYDGDNGLIFSALEVTPGVQWRSESGVFLAHLSAVPPAEPRVGAPRLAPNYPNPFNPATRIPFELAAAGNVDLTIHDLAGALVRRLVVGAPFGTGRHEAVWDGRDGTGRPMAAGTYVCRIRTRQGADARTLVLLK